MSAGGTFLLSFWGGVSTALAIVIICLGLLLRRLATRAGEAVVNQTGAVADRAPAQGARARFVTQRLDALSPTPGRE